MTLRVISYGGGVQSTAMVVLAATRDPAFEAAVGGPVDAALFCNVGDDSEHPDALRWVRDVVQPWAADREFPVIELHRHTRDGRPETLMGRLTKPGSRSFPIPVRMSNGAPGNRSCTADFKIRVVAKWLRERGASADDPATTCIGISTDEISRVNNRSDEPYETRCYPLIELGMDRSACQEVNVSTFGRPAPKSSCYFCPFHTPAVWAEMRRDEPDLFQRSVDLERLLNERRDAISCSTSAVPGVETRRVWRWSEPDGWLLADVDPAEAWPDWMRGHPDAGHWQIYGTCPDCNHREMLLDPDGSVPPHGKDHVYFTRFARPLAEAIPEAQTPLFAGAGHDIGETGCDEGVCFV